MHQEAAAKLLDWVIVRTEMYSEARALVCSAFLQDFQSFKAWHIETSKEKEGDWNMVTEVNMDDSDGDGNHKQQQRSHDVPTTPSMIATSHREEEEGEGGQHNAFLSEIESESKALLGDLITKNSTIERDLLEFIQGNIFQTKSKGYMLCLLMTLKYLPSAILDELTTCILRLTYEDVFKYEFTHCMIIGYQGVCDVDTGEHTGTGQVQQQADQNMLRNFLTRLTVQLFNCPDMTLELVEKHNLLDTVLGFLNNLLERTRPAGERPGELGPVDVRSHYIEDRTYSRTLGDIQMILDHESTIIPFILRKRVDLFEQILASFEKLQGMNVYHRKTGTHVERENTDWINCIMLESDMFLNMFDQIFTGITRQIRKEGLSNETLETYEASISNMCAFAISQAASWVEQNPNSMLGGNEISCENEGGKDSVFARLLHGEGVSINLPLHRVSSRMLSLQLAPRSNWLGLSNGEASASNVSPLGGKQRQKLLEVIRANEANIRLMIEPVLKLAGFMVQVRVGLWVRNGEEVLKLQRTYSTGMWFWHELSWEPDNFLLKAWVATVDSRRALDTLVDAFGGGFLLHLRSSEEIKEKEIVRIPWIAECLQELMKVVVDRTHAYPIRERVRRDLIHWLFVNEKQTHSKLTQLLSLSHRNYSGIDGILSEIADYHEPKLQQHGQYKLKSHCWEEFDTFYPLYSKADLQKALENAERSNYWKPEMQFTSSVRSLRSLDPSSSSTASGSGDEKRCDPLQFVFKVLHCNHFYQLIWASLLVALQKPSGYAEGVINAVLHLLYHKMDQEGERRKEGSFGHFDVGSESPSAAGFTSNSMKESLAFNPEGGQPSILAMLHFVADLNHNNSGSENTTWRASQQASFGASGNLKLCVKFILDQLRAKGHTHLVEKAEGEENSDTMAADDDGSIVDEEGEALKKQRADRQAAVMATFSAQQQAFLDTISDSDTDMENADEGDDGANAVDTDKVKSAMEEEFNSECALCKGNTKDVTSLCWVGHCQVNLFPSRGTKENLSWEDTIAKHQRAGSTTGGASLVNSYSPTNCGFDMSYGMNVKTCGHKMHFGCYKNYMKTLLDRMKSGLGYEGMNILNLDDMEFLCPVCRRLSNVLIPCTTWKVSKATQKNNAASTDIQASILTGLDYFVNQCRSVFETFVSKTTMTPRKKIIPEPSSDPFLLDASKLIEIIGYNASHFEVLLRKQDWIDAEAPRCAGKGQLTILKDLVANFRTVKTAGNLPTYEEGVRKVQKIIDFLSMQQQQQDPQVSAMLVEASAADESTPVVKEEGEGEEGSCSCEPTFPFVKEFLLKHSPPSNQRHLDFSHLNILSAPTSVLEEGIRKDILAYNCDRGLSSGEEVLSLCDPFRFHLETLLLEDGREERHLIYRVAVAQAASYFILNTYSNAVCEHLSLIDSSMDRETAPDQSHVDGMYGELQLTLDGIMGHTFGGVLRERMLEFTEKSVEPFVRRVFLVSECVKVGGEDSTSTGTLCFNTLAEEGLPGLPAMHQSLGYPSIASVLSQVGQGGGGVHQQQQENSSLLARWCPNVIPQIKDIWFKTQHQSTSERPSLGSVLTSLNYSLVRNPSITSPSLIELPHLYQSALVEWLNTKCHRCDKVPKEPALCLVCGQLTCCAESCCADAKTRGECTQHSLACGARTGIFLLLRQTSILILSGSHACIYSSPYLDQHGEEDPSLKRGKPLYLDRNRYQALNLLWATGAFDYDSKVLKHSHGGTRRAFSAEFY
jgi:hypothetical protein